MSENKNKVFENTSISTGERSIANISLPYNKAIAVSQNIIAECSHLSNMDFDLAEIQASLEKLNHKDNSNSDYVSGICAVQRVRHSLSILISDLVNAPTVKTAADVQKHLVGPINTLKCVKAGLDSSVFSLQAEVKGDDSDQNAKLQSIGLFLAALSISLEGAISNLVAIRTGKAQLPKGTYE